MVRTLASQARNVEFESHIRQLFWSHRINGQFTGLSIRKCWVRVPLGSLWLSYKGSTSDCGSEDMGSIPIGHTCIINAVCPGSEEAVLKTVGPKGLAGANPVYGAYRWMSRIGIAADHQGSRSRFARSRSSIALPELPKNSPLDCFLYDNSPLHLLICLYKPNW